MDGRHDPGLSRPGVVARLARDLFDVAPPDRWRLALALLEDWQRYDRKLRAWTAAVLQLAETLELVPPERAAEEQALVAMAGLDRTRAERLVDGLHGRRWKEFDRRLQNCGRLAAGVGETAREALVQPEGLTAAQQLVLLAARCDQQLVTLCADGQLSGPSVDSPAQRRPAAHAVRSQRARTPRQPGGARSRPPTHGELHARIPRVRLPVLDQPSPGSQPGMPAPGETAPEEAGRPEVETVAEYLDAVRNLLADILGEARSEFATDVEKQLQPLQVQVAQLANRTRDDHADVVASLDTLQRRIVEARSLSEETPEPRRPGRNRRAEERERRWQDQEREWQDQRNVLLATVNQLRAEVRRLQESVAAERSVRAAHIYDDPAWTTRLITAEEVAAVVAGGSAARGGQQAGRSVRSGRGPGTTAGGPSPGPRSGAGSSGPTGGTGASPDRGDRPATTSPPTDGAALQRDGPRGIRPVWALNLVACAVLGVSAVALAHDSGQPRAAGSDNGAPAVMFCVALAYLILAVLIALWPQRHRVLWFGVHAMLLVGLALVTIAPLSVPQFPYAAWEATSTPYDGSAPVAAVAAAEWIDAPSLLGTGARSGPEAYEANQAALLGDWLTAAARHRGGLSRAFLNALQPLLNRHEVTLTEQGYQVSAALPSPASRALWQKLFHDAAKDPTVPTQLLMELYWQWTGYIPAADRPPSIGDAMLWVAQLDRGADGSCGHVHGDFLDFDNGYQKLISDRDAFGIPDEVLHRYVCATG